MTTATRPTITSCSATDEELKQFRSQTEPQSNGCIYWTGRLTWKGYGDFWFRGGSIRAHRFSFSLSQELVDRQPLDHVCHNRDRTCLGGNTCPHRRCVNPLHLEAVTTRENLMRSALAPSRLNAEKTECPRGHPYDQSNTFVRANGQRECRECGRAETRRYLEAHRDEHNARRRAARRAAA